MGRLGYLVFFRLFIIDVEYWEPRVVSLWEKRKEQYKNHFKGTVDRAWLLSRNVEY